MATSKIIDLPSGSVIKIKVNGQYEEFVILRHSKPSEDYDASCDGTWLFMKNIYTLEEFGESQLYASSYITNYLNTSFYGALENGVRGVVKEVKIPYSLSKDVINKGADGYPCKVFLLSASEIGFTNENLNVEGSSIEYFNDPGNKIANYNKEPHNWLTRSLNKSQDSQDIFYVDEAGELQHGVTSDRYGIRPVIVIYSSCLVKEDGTLVPNIAPIITSSIENGSNLGTKDSTFTFTYTVTTSRPDLALEIEEELSGINYIKTKKIVEDPVSGSERTFSIVVNDPDAFFKLMNGEKKITIRARYSDYSDASVQSESEYYVTFSKSVNQVTITLKTPLTVSGNITKGFLKLDSNIPDDASFKVEVTNNGNQGSPTWKNVTTNVKSESDFTFDSTGSSFNFRVTVQRGASDTSGYIASITGAFE